MNLVERLREGHLLARHQDGTETWESPHTLNLEAADRIEELEKELVAWRRVGQGLHNAGVRTVEVPSQPEWGSREYVKQLLEDGK